jgi:hypothetical protein
MAGIFGSIGNIVGSIAGNIASKKDRESQLGAMEQALTELRNAGTPPDLAKEIIYQQYQQAGILTPELEQDLDIADSNVANMQVDSTGRDAQLQALNLMQQASKGGLRAEDRASLNQVRQEAQRDSEGKRQQILQQMRAQGMGTAGAGLAAQLQAAQSEAEQQSEEGDRISSMASQRALEALGSYGNMGSNLRSDDTNLANTRAQALDDRNKFLYENSAARQQRNIASKNTAQQQNLATKQQLANANTEMANQEKIRQMQGSMDTYNAKMNKAQALANVEQNKSGVHGTVAAQKAKQYTDMGGGAGEMADSATGQSILGKLFGG